jgi:SNF2 family DNA or RNA helicase
MHVDLIDGVFVLKTDYEERVRARSVGAKWDGKTHRWTVPANAFAAEKLLRLPNIGGIEKVRAFLEGFDRGASCTVPKTKLPLKDHQLAMVSQWLTKKRYMYFAEMGTGKTPAVIGGVQNLFDEKKLDLALVVAPLSVLNAWTRQIEKFCAVKHRVIMLTGPSKKRLDKIEDVKYLRKSFKGKVLIWVLVNYEALNRFEEQLGMLRPGAICYDETTRIKNHSAATTKAAIRMSDIAEYVVGLNGTPISNDVSELWSQCRAVSREFLGDGSSSFWEFVYEYCVMGGWKGKQVVGTKNLERLEGLVKKFSYRVRKEDVLDLPGRTWTAREVQLEGEQLAAYKSAEKEFYFSVDAVKKHTGERRHYAILVKNALGRLLRCQQIAAGFCKSEQGDIVRWPDNPKSKQLVDIVKEAGKQKVVVFSRFIEDIEMSREALQKEGIVAVTYHGGVKQEARSNIENAFLDRKSDLQVVLAQVQTGGLGIDFSTAPICVFNTNWFSWGVRDQAESRVHRPGQTSNVLYIDNVASDTVDETVLMTIMDKKSISEVLFGAKIPEAEEVAAVMA